MVELEIILGRRGAGKSTLAAQRAVSASREGPLVVVHDPMKDFPAVGAIATKASHLSWHRSGIYILRAPDLMTEVLTVCKKQAPLNPRGCYLVLDEGVFLLSGPHPGKLKRQLQEIIATARHVQLRLLIIAQGSNLLDYQMLALADRLDLFSVTDRWNAEKLRAAGVPESVTKSLLSLPDRQYYTGRPGRPAEEWQLFSTQVPTVNVR